jgi:hypothetical protein
MKTDIIIEDDRGNLLAHLEVPCKLPELPLLIKYLHPVLKVETRETDDAT